METIRRNIGNYVRHLKSARFVRRAAKPFKDYTRNRRHTRYMRTADCYYLKTLKNIHEGQRCFILGNGPSLTATDCDKLVGEVTFASNRIYKIFDETQWRPTYYMSIDKEFLTKNYLELSKYDLGHMFIANYSKRRILGPLNKVTRIFCERLDFDEELKEWNDRTAYIAEDVSDHICAGHTVTFYAIQLAIYMGFKEIYLLGVDNSYSVWLDENGRITCDETIKDYFDGRHYPSNCLFSPASLNYAYMAAREYCDSHDIRIYNATRGGKLEVFERVNFDNIFGGGRRNSIVLAHLLSCNPTRPESEAA